MLSGPKQQARQAVQVGGFLTPTQAAAIAAVEVDWLLRFARKNQQKVGFRKLGHRTVRFEPVAFQAWITGRRGR
jgi:hypothetical protein